ncbi:hypothetical protein [Alicyclobacillus dauci]|uniref:Uncharacterized protein n=1 Tax=Alicyclobacillus dauci TaxID=1475485 RepID=A0ABY6Z385_9BACL|nr:hypothetical protein [Alicyclobacillus dauci]WAH37343.1 hypothetical protein NZD86_02005 [Alicyclobacillus dauci]
MFANVPYFHPVLLTIFLCLFVAMMVFTMVWSNRRGRLGASLWLLVAGSIFVLVTVVAAT